MARRPGINYHGRRYGTPAAFLIMLFEVLIKNGYEIGYFLSVALGCVPNVLNIRLYSPY